MNEDKGRAAERFGSVLHAPGTPPPPPSVEFDVARA